MAEELEEEEEEAEVEIEGDDDASTMKNGSSAKNRGANLSTVQKSLITFSP